jgi:hypothetical protein
MDFDLKDILGYLQEAAQSVGAVVTSPWFYFQLGLIVIGAGLAYGAGAGVRARIDLTSLAMGRPAPLRHVLRVLVDSVQIAVFTILMGLARLVMVMSTWPSRSYMLSVAGKLGLAWLVISLISTTRSRRWIRSRSCSADCGCRRFWCSSSACCWWWRCG